MSSDILYVGENLIKQRHAGSKARVDVETVFHERYKQLLTVQQKSFRGTADKIKFLLSPDTLSTMMRLLSNSPDNPIVVQYPSYFNPIYNWLIINFIWHHQCVLFVHDVETLRYEDEHAVRKEISLMNCTKAVILHNAKMTKALRHQGLIVPVVELGLFDYLLYHGIPQQERKLDSRIVFAGNLAKSKFLTLIPHSQLNLKFELYGIGCPDEVSNDANVSYHGSFDADELPYYLEGSFGLVWDGSSLDTCDGPLGHYLKFNNPHKISLYLASGLPVIVWSQSAMADLVQSEHIGIVADNLHQVSTLIHQMTSVEYEEMLVNVKKIQEKITAGYFTKRALDNLEKLL